MKMKVKMWGCDVMCCVVFRLFVYSRLIVSRGSGGRDCDVFRLFVFFRDGVLGVSGLGGEECDACVVCSLSLDRVSGFGGDDGEMSLDRERKCLF